MNIRNSRMSFQQLDPQGLSYNWKPLELLKGHRENNQNRGICKNCLGWNLLVPRVMLRTDK